MLRLATLTEHRGIRDESIHGVYVGLIAQELYNQLSAEEQDKAARERLELLNTLYENELDTLNRYIVKLDL